MICLVGLDDTDSAGGGCTTYLAYRIASDLRQDFRVLPYPRLVRLNPNVPFKTRGNAAVCLRIETNDPDSAFKRICSTVSEFSDVAGGANAGVVFLEDLGLVSKFEPIYLDAMCGLVNPHRTIRLLREHGIRHMTLGKGMGLVGAACSLAFDERFDHTYELISYRLRRFWGTTRLLDASSVREMDRETFPHTFNNYDYQKRKVLIAPHGPDPVFVGIRGDSPRAVLNASKLVDREEELDGHLVYLSNQHTDAHLTRPLDWKVFSSGWAEGEVEHSEVGTGGHCYFSIHSGQRKHLCAVYEPTGDLRRVARLLRARDGVRVFGGVRRATSKHPKILNVEKIDVLSLGPETSLRTITHGSYVASPRANRHLTKPLIRYGNEVPGESSEEVEGWLSNYLISTRALARSR